MDLPQLLPLLIEMFSKFIYMQANCNEDCDLCENRIGFSLETN